MRKKFSNKYFILKITLILIAGAFFAKNIFYKKSSYLGFENYKFWKFSVIISKPVRYFKEILSMSAENEILKNENARLYQIILNKNISTSIEDKKLFDYKVISAKVVLNSFFLSKNYIILDKGSKNGIYQGMGVLTIKSPVGIIIDTSENFSIAASMLNSNFWLSVKVLPCGFSGSINWEKINPKYITLYISKHANINIGDEVVTSGFGSVFPSDIKVGKIKNIRSKGNSPSYEVDVTLNENIGAISTVFLIDYKKLEEKNTLTNKVSELSS